MAILPFPAPEEAPQCIHDGALVMFRREDDLVILCGICMATVKIMPVAKPNGRVRCPSRWSFANERPS